MTRISIEIDYVLSSETTNRYKDALLRVEEAKAKANGKVTDIRLDKDSSDNPVGIIEMEVDQPET